MLTQERAHQLFDYCNETGYLTWKPDTFAFKRQTDGHAGTMNGKGYRIVKADGYWYMVHRVVWLMHFGSWPIDQIDHIDRDQYNNRIENLRDVDGSTNCHNQDLRTNNNSGHTGVSKRGNKWRAVICDKGIRNHLGTFDTFEEAVQAYKIAKSPYSPERMVA